MLEAIISLIIAAVILLGTPGPATLSLAGVGASFGIKSGLNFLGGILTGLCVVIFGAILGLAAVFSAFPEMRLVTQIIGGFYICYLAIKIALAPLPSDSATVKQSKLGFIEGVVLMLLNPKAYAALLALFSQFLLPFSSTTVAFIATGVVCIVVGIIVDSVWLFFGGAIRPLLKKPQQVRAMNIIFAVLMVVAVFWAFIQ